MLNQVRPSRSTRLERVRDTWARCMPSRRHAASASVASFSWPARQTLERTPDCSPCCLCRRRRWTAGRARQPATRPTASASITTVGTRAPERSTSWRQVPPPLAALPCEPATIPAPRNPPKLWWVLMAPRRECSPPPVLAATAELRWQDSGATAARTRMRPIATTGPNLQRPGLAGLCAPTHKMARGLQGLGLPSAVANSPLPPRSRLYVTSYNGAGNWCGLRLYPLLACVWLRSASLLRTRARAACPSPSN